MPIPDFDPATGYLPPGIHLATLAEVYDIYSYNYKRRQHLAGLAHVAEQLYEKAVTRIFLDGSFVTAKERPRDIDVVYIPPEGTDPDTWGHLAPINRKTLKRVHHLDLWPYPSPQERRPPTVSMPNPTVTFKIVPILQFFQEDRNGIEKGIIELTTGEDQ